MKRNAIREIASRLEHHREEEFGDIGGLLAYLQQTIGEHIVDATQKVGEKCEDIQLDLSKVDYSRLAKGISTYKYKKLLLKQLTENAEEIVASMLLNNPACANYQQDLQKIIDEYNSSHEKAAIEKALQDILKLIGTLSSEQEKFVKEGLDDMQQLAVYEMLKTGKTLSKKELDEVKGIAKELLSKLRSLVADIDNWRDKATAKALVRTAIKNVLYEKLPDSIRSDDERKEYEEMVYNYFYQLPDAA